MTGGPADRAAGKATGQATGQATDSATGRATGGSSASPPSAVADVWRAASYARSARFVTDLGAPLVDLLDPRPGERVLDIGCGDGALSAALVARGAQVVGVDASADMVAAARGRGLDARLGRAETLDAVGAEDPFDAVFSNAALHWVPDQQAALDAASRALRPGGRLVVEMGGHGNVAAIRTALVAALGEVAGLATDLSEIWCFPTAPEQRARLERAGLAPLEATLFSRPTVLTIDLETWIDTLAAPVLALAPAEARGAVRDRAAALAGPALRDASGVWTADYVRLRFVARKA